MTATFHKAGVMSDATVWTDRLIYLNGDDQHLRNSIKNQMDNFLNVYLEANPRRFIDDVKSQ